MILKAVKSKDASSVFKAIADGADVNEKSVKNGQTALTLACEAGSLEIVRILLNAGADPNLSGELGYSPLMCAATSSKKSSDALAICQLLMAQGADIEARNGDGESAIEVLLYAPGNKPNEAIAEFLILEMQKAEPKPDFSKIAFLIVDYGHLKTLQLLVQNGLDLEAKDRFGYTLLHSACRSHAIKKVDFLLRAGANFNFQPKLGWGDHPFDLACRFKRIDWLKFLKKNGFKFEENQELLQTAINSAVEMGHWKVLNFLELEGIVLSAKRGKLNSAIFTAIEFNQAKAIDHFLENGADINERDAKGNTPLHHAAYHGRFEILKTLHAAGAELNALNNLGWNALMQASANHNLEIAAHLIESGIDLNQLCSETGATALFIAATEGDGKIVAALVKAGADPSIHAKDGKTAATSALSGYKSEIVALLGGIQPHFAPYLSKGQKIVCAYCAKVIPEEIADHSYCSKCDACYCDSHFRWSEWRVMHQTSVYPERNASCPNGHTTWEDFPR